MRLTVAFFSAALFVSAALLFWVQPVIAKMLLPLLGGAPAVWNTCMLFFQALLLAGYAYALIISQRLRLRNQALLHVALLLAAGYFLPFAISPGMLSSLPTESNPTPWLLGALLVTVGPPFFALSATAPLLQRWFSYSNHNSAKDPYFLYAVSNAGSMLSLLAFPFLLEPSLAIRRQTVFWALGYVLLAVLISCCAVALKERAVNNTESMLLKSDAEVLTIRRRLYWLVLSFIPSSLMLGVTTYISTDVASVPLIWIIPLALYLLTFILAFANKQLISLRLAALLLPAVLVFLGFMLILRPQKAVWVIIGLHLIVFFLAALICHRRLSLARPSVAKLPEYYLWIAIGGVLGGIFNALLAPHIFPTPMEYPLVVIMACMMRPSEGHRQWSRPWVRVAFPSFVLLLVVALSYLVPSLNLTRSAQNALVLCLPLAFCYLAASRQSVAFALSLLAIMLGGYRYGGANDKALTTERNFFGVWRVSSDKNGSLHRLQHGTTVHGWQYTDPVRRCNATTYYHKDGPLGQVFDAYNAKPSTKYVAAIGLGAGTVVSYSTANQYWDFYEIDPAIVRIAKDERYFTFLNGCAAAPYRMILGDARLQLREAPTAHYGLLILDAFSSDSVPAHLLTTQALELYLSKLSQDGLAAFHVTNRYLDLEPLLSGLSTSAGLTAFIRADKEFDSTAGKYNSTWVVMARSDTALGGIMNDSRWRRLRGNIVWTDDFSNILDLMK